MVDAADNGGSKLVLNGSKPSDYTDVRSGHLVESTHGDSALNSGNAVVWRYVVTTGLLPRWARTKSCSAKFAHCPALIESKVIVLQRKVGALWLDPGVLRSSGAAQECLAAGLLVGAVALVYATRVGPASH